MTEKRKDHSSRRRFVRRLVTFGAVGGIGALLSERVAEKPLIQLAQAASGDYLSMDNVNTATGTTELDSDLTTSGSDVALRVVASATSGTMRGIYGESLSPDGCGVEGYASEIVSASGNAVGVYGHSDAPNTAGVRGIATASSSNIYSEAGGTAHYTAGVEGYASAGSGPVQGVYGHTDSTDGAGVWGVASSVSGQGCGVGGYGFGSDATGVWGRSYATSGWAAGVAGRTDSTDGNAIWGHAWATAGSAKGVYGQSDSPNGVGVEGYASTSVSTSGNAAGVYGHADAPNTVGVRGIVTSSSGNWTMGADRYTTGIEGYASAGSGPVQGVWGHADSPDGVGVWGLATATSGACFGVVGNSYSPDGVAVWGYSRATSGWGPGVAGRTNSTDGTAVCGLATASTGYATGVYGRSDSISGTGVLGVAGNPGAVPIAAHAASSQTAPLQEWQNYAGSPLAVVDKDGNFGIGTASPVRQVHIRGNNAVGRLDRDVDSASFIFVRTKAGDFNTVWKSFTFGVKATGVDTGSFFIGDMHTNVSGSSDNRILIDTSGNVGIGTTTPSSKLHVAGRVKALGYDTGDITYANGMTTTEEGTGLAFLNDAGEKIAVLDREGNFHIKGKFVEDL